MKSTDNVGITFVNAVLGRGIINGVINVQLGVLEFGNTEDGKVSDQFSVACRLRMDVTCAESLRDHLTAVLALVEEAKTKATTKGIAVNGDASHASEGKPN